jgi:hypothetical protein
MTTLRDRLADLADEAAGAAPGSAAAGVPGDLWRAGRRLHHRRRVGTGVVVMVAAALLVGLGGLGWTQSRTSVQPAGVETELGMPDQIWAADEHLPGTDDTGPIGPLTAVVVTPRSGWLRGSSNAVLGISATGEYAYLDLPRQLDPTVAAPAISADGRMVAYWRVGSPSGAPGHVGADGSDQAPVGVAVYDTTTGETVQHLVDTEHGLQPEHLLWVGDHLWFDVWQMDAPRDDGGQSASLTDVVAWNPRSDDVRAAPRLDLAYATAWDDAVVTSRRDRLLRTTVDGTETLGVLRSRVFDFVTPFFVSPGSTQVTAQERDDAGGPWPLLVGSVDRNGGTIALDEAARGNRYEGELLGWRDDDHVVVVDNGAGTGEATYQSVDVNTGEAQILGYAEGNRPILAADALAGPVFEAPEPPTPLHPLLVWGSAVGVVAVAGVSLLWWRRRVQR